MSDLSSYMISSALFNPFHILLKKKIFPETSLSICKTYQSEKL